MKLTLKLASALLITSASVPSYAADTSEIGILGYLGLQTVTGKTELGPDGGTLESWTLVAELMGSAADAISTDVGAGSPILLLGDTENFDTSPYYTVQFRLRDFAQKLGTLCQTDLLGLSEEPRVSLSPADILAAVRQDKEFSDKVIEPAEKMFITAIANKLRMRGPSSKVYTKDSLQPNGSAKILAEWYRLEKEMKQYKIKPACKENAEFAELLASFNTAKELFFTADDSGNPSYIERASALDALLADTSFKILKPRIEKAGGTVVKTTNILTALGYPAIKLSGALVVSYQTYTIEQNVVGGVTVTTSPQIDKSNILVCTGPMRRLGSINRAPKSSTKQTATKMVASGGCRSMSGEIPSPPAS